MTLTFTGVTSAQTLSDDIRAIDLDSQAGSGTGTAYSIALAQGVTLLEAADISAINLKGNDTLTINGNSAGTGANAVIDGGNAHRGLFVYSGTVTIENLTIENAVANGGNGGRDGGGGAGLGGGLFVAGTHNVDAAGHPLASGGKVTLS